MLIRILGEGKSLKDQRNDQGWNIINMKREPHYSCLNATKYFILELQWPDLLKVAVLQIDIDTYFIKTIVLVEIALPGWKSKHITDSLAQLQ